MGQIMGKIRNTNEKVKKVCNAVLDPQWWTKHRYIEYYETLPIDEHSILLESQHGREINGNVFYLIRYLSQSEKYAGYRISLTVMKGRAARFERVLRFYGLKNIHLVVLYSDEYFRLLASAKYLINDNTFLPFFMKKDGQIYLNTWHGTPLKSLGRQIKNDAIAIGNAQKNFATADYLLFPNDHTRDVMIRDYMIGNIASGSSVMAGYPRNEAFFSAGRKEEIREALGLSGKRIYAYMPTFRGVARQAGTQKNTYYLNYYLLELDKKLESDEILYVNLHPIAGKDVNFSMFKRIRKFPKEYETYDFLNAADVLVTDYSSVFFDFACTGKKIILFTYDKEEYLADRGMYFSIDSFPFPQVADETELIRELRSAKQYDDRAFLEQFCKYENKSASQRLCDRIILGEDTGIQPEKIEGNGKKNVLVYAGNLAGNGMTASLRSLLSVLDLQKKNYYITFYTEKVCANAEALFSFSQGVNYYAMMGDMNLSVFERVVRKLFKRKWIRADRYMEIMGKRVEQGLDRCLGSARFDEVIHFTGYEHEIILSLSTFKGNKAIFVHSNMVREIEDKGNQRHDVLNYAYNAYDRVAIVTDDMYEPTARISGKKDNMVVVRNTVDYLSVLKKAQGEIRLDPESKANMPVEEICRILSDPEKEVFVNVGRFSPEKGHERLLDAFAEYLKEHSDAYLMIMGGYSLNNGYEKLLERIAKMGLDKRVVLIENVSNPYPLLKACDYFVLSSFYEGFGLVLAEADILGLPVVSTDIPGPRGFMKKHGGTLVDNSQEGICRGMKMLHEGKIPPMNVDYEQYNRDAIAEFERLFD